MASQGVKCDQTDLVEVDQCVHIHRLKGVAAMPREHKYLKRSDRDIAYINYKGKKIDLGKYDSPESWELYYRLLAQIAARQEPRIHEVVEVHSINVLIVKFMEHVRQRYVKRGKPTSEVRSYISALRPLRKLYGHLLPNDFGPLALEACRQELIKEEFTRNRINGHVSRICRCFKWGIAKQVVKVTTWQALTALENLRPGEAKDNPKIEPVLMEHVLAIQPFVTPQIWSLIQFQLLTACRPGEACIVRGCDVDDDVYRPASHKTEHHGIDRAIPLGPTAGELVRQWAKEDPTAYLWSPWDAREWHFANRRENAKYPLQEKKPRKSKPKREPGRVYTVTTYEDAVERACFKAGVPKWTPNRLRHLAATLIRKNCDMDTARVVLGHRSAKTSETYAKADLEKAKAAMRELG